MTKEEIRKIIREKSLSEKIQDMERKLNIHRKSLVDDVIEQLMDPDDSGLTRDIQVARNNIEKLEDAIKAASKLIRKNNGK
ncbi:MAG: hypothetical protein ACK5MR_10120 [Cumulibacter sp.]